MTVELDFGEPDGLRRLQALMNAARSEFNLKNVGLLDGLTPNLAQINLFIGFGNLTRYRFGITLRMGLFFEDSRDLLWRNLVSSLGNTLHQVKELTIDMTILLPTPLTYPGAQADKDSQLWRWYDLDAALSRISLKSLRVELHTDVPWLSMNPPRRFKEFSECDTLGGIRSTTDRAVFLTQAEGGDMYNSRIRSVKRQLHERVLLIFD